MTGLRAEQFVSHQHDVIKHPFKTQIKMAKLLAGKAKGAVDLNDASELRDALRSFNPSDIPTSSKSAKNLLDLSQTLEDEINKEKTLKPKGDKKKIKDLEAFQTLVCARGYAISNELYPSAIQSDTRGSVESLEKGKAPTDPVQSSTELESKATEMDQAVDASNSMKFENKFERARQLGAAMGVTALMGVERVSAYVVGASGEPPRVMPPSSGRASMRRLFDFFERAECGGDAPIDGAVEAMLRRHRGRGMAIVISDFLTPASLARPFNLLYSAGLEIFALQVLGPTEIDPELTGDLRLVDSENGTTVDVSSIDELHGIYHEHREQLQEHVRRQSRTRNGRFLSISSEAPLDWVLFDLLQRQGWLK